MVEGGPIDVLTGDWLAELTMLILAKQRRRDPSAGYARTFVRQMEETLGTCLERNIKVVSNAGGLNPRGCALAIEELAGRLGLAPVVATVTGDDVLSRLRDLEGAGERLKHLDTVPNSAPRVSRRSPPTPTSATGGSPRRCSEARTS